jgi:nicotinamide mononucleotide transporter
MPALLKKLDTYYPYLMLFITALICLVNRETIFLTSIALAGVLCVILAARGNIWNYVIGIYNATAYAYVAYLNGLYGEMGLNLFFFLPTAIVGWFLWRKKLSRGSTVLMRRLSMLHRSALFIACIILTILTGFLLSLIPTQNTPYIDALTNVLSIIATLLMMYRFQEQWFLYITLNIFTIFMWFLRMSAGSGEGSAMLLMWSIYLINSIYGAIKWHIGVKANKQEAAV